MTLDAGSALVAAAPVAEQAPVDVRHARRLARISLVAAGAAPARDVITNYELTMGSLADRRFQIEAVAAGFADLHSDGWPCELVGLALDEAEVVLRDGDHEAVLRLSNGALAHVALHHGWFRVRLAGPTQPAVMQAFGAFRSRYPASYLTEDGDTRAPITFWTLGQFGPVSRLRKIEAASWEDVQANYPASVRDDLSALMGWRDDTDRADGQLLLWQGPPGTGKTWALRALASEWADWAEFHYITDPDAFFCESPSYMVDVLLADSYGAIDEPTGDVYDVQPEGGKWRVLILEDTGELLAANAKDAYGQGLSRLLNVVDGMIGQGLRVLCLVTTNDELGDLHPAVQRPGRCAQALTFAPFEMEEADEWLAAHGHQGSPLEGSRLDGTPLTVAELYAVAGAAPAPAFADEPADDAAVAPDATCADEACGHPGSMHAGADNMGACNEGGCACEGFVLPASSAEPDGAAEATVADASLPAEHQPQDTRPVPQPGLTPPPAATPARAETTGSPWQADFAPEGRPTDDGRIMAPGAISWRSLPLSLMAMLETQEGHNGARVCGRIDAIWRNDELSMIQASGVFDGGDFGSEIERLVGDRTLGGLSVDLAIHESILVEASQVLDENGAWTGLPDEGDLLDIWDLLEGNIDGQILFVVTEAVIGAATICPFPAFAEAEISLAAAGGLPPFAPVNTLTVRASFRVGDAEVEGLTASAAGLAPDRPPVEWFDDPALDALTALVVTDEGRISGHAAPWGTCHIGIPGVCTTAPHSQTGYRFFHLGELECADGETVAVGHITLDTGHADRRLGWQPAAAHYDNTGTVVADVRAGEDEFGIWISGAIRPDLSTSKLRELRSAVPSGDWRDVDGNLEMVGVLAVNVPGFPVPRADALIAAGQHGNRVLALVAAGHGKTAPVITAGDAERLRALAALADGRFAVLAAEAAQTGSREPGEDS